jgi:hypothetical protein
MGIMKDLLNIAVGGMFEKDDVNGYKELVVPGVPKHFQKLAILMRLLNDGLQFNVPMNYYLRKDVIDLMDTIKEVVPLTKWYNFNNRFDNIETQGDWINALNDILQYAQYELMKYRHISDLGEARYVKLKMALDSFYAKLNEEYEVTPWSPPPY